jgi:hypothetical protein
MLNMFNKEIISKASRLTEEALNGPGFQDMLEVKLGDRTLFVSQDESKLVSISSFMVRENIYHVGFRKSDTEI